MFRRQHKTIPGLSAGLPASVFGKMIIFWQKCLTLTKKSLINQQEGRHGGKGSGKERERQIDIR